MRSLSDNYTVTWFTVHAVLFWRYLLTMIGLAWIVFLTIRPMLTGADLGDSDVDQRSPWYLVAIYHITWRVRNAGLYVYGMCRDPHRYLRGYRHSRLGRYLISLFSKDECVIRWYDLGSALKVEAMRP